MFGINSYFPSFSTPTKPKTSYSTGTSSAGGLIGGIISAIGSIIIGGLNYSLKKKQYEWQKKAWNQQMAREDNAMQRRVLDLQNAGLSPVLAAGGSGASASTAPQIQAPQLEMNMAEQAMMVMSLLQGQKNIAKTEAETQMIRAQTGLTGQNIQKQKWDNKLNRQYGTPSNPSMPGSIYRDAASTFDTWFNKMKNFGGQMIEREKNIWRPYYNKAKKLLK